MNIGIFGGTFDPPHIGHLILAAEAKAQANLDLVLWVLTSYPPHKKGIVITPVEERLQMVELSIQDNPDFVISKVDIDRQPPYYAVDTVSILKNQSPRDKFYYVMGQDSVNDLPLWHQPREFVSLCDGIIVMTRYSETYNPIKLEADAPGVNEKLHFLKTPIIDISSSDIRKRVQTGIQYRYFVTEPVYKYIKKQKLYLY